jgi:hypothetical protein
LKYLSFLEEIKELRQSLITTTADSLPPAVDASDNDGDSLSDVQDPMDIATTVDAGLSVQENSHVSRSPLCRTRIAAWSRKRMFIANLALEVSPNNK